MRSNQLFAEYKIDYYTNSQGIVHRVLKISHIMAICIVISVFISSCMETAKVVKEKQIQGQSSFRGGRSILMSNYSHGDKMILGLIPILMVLGQEILFILKTFVCQYPLTVISFTHSSFIGSILTRDNLMNSLSRRTRLCILMSLLILKG